MFSLTVCKNTSYNYTKRIFQTIFITWMHMSKTMRSVYTMWIFIEYERKNLPSSLVKFLNVIYNLTKKGITKKKRYSNDEFI